MKCEHCASQIINDDLEEKLCDACYWAQQAVEANEALVRACTVIKYMYTSLQRLVKNLDTDQTYKDETFDNPGATKC